MRISRVSAGMPPEGAPRSGYVQASVFAHEVRVTLTTSAMERGPHRMVLQLTEGNRFLSGLPVAISVSRPLRPLGTARPMHGSGASYWADIDVAQGGDWEIYPELREAPSRSRLAPFLLHVDSSPAGRVWSLYPLFTPVNGWHPSISIPLGRYAADIHVAIAPFGQARFSIHLRSEARGSQLPSRLRLGLTMPGMKMGYTYPTVYRVQGSMYSAQALFSMPGTWSIGISDGTVKSTAALLVGERG